VLTKRRAEITFAGQKNSKLSARNVKKKYSLLLLPSGASLIVCTSEETLRSSLKIKHIVNLVPRVDLEPKLVLYKSMVLTKEMTMFILGGMILISDENDVFPTRSFQ
jgi:hypothetical protein